MARRRLARRRRRPRQLRSTAVGIVVAVLAAAALGAVIARPWTDAAPAPVAAPGVVLSATATADAPARGAASASAQASTSTSTSATAGADATRPASPQAGPPSAKAASAPAGFRAVTFVNNVQQTIWVGAGEQTPQPALATTGWMLPAGQSLTITVPDKWNGRFWGRTGCQFNAAGSGHCQTGDCAERFQCAQYGAIPATLAEFNLNSWRNLDFYDVSMVDGSNLPMYINIVKGATKDPISPTGCSAAGCTRPVACPSALQVHAGGAVVGCESPCGVFGTDQYCCRGQWAPRSACDPTKWPVDYATLFKQAEPFAYSYVDDDATSTFTCSGECDYRITFGLSP